MSVIKPFKALRPAAGKARNVSCVPYDVIYTSEARETIADNPESFLRVTRPEADLPKDAEPTGDEILERARQNLERLIEQNTLAQDTEAAIFVYRLDTGEHAQTGIVGCFSIDEYDRNLIKRHEKTRPDKVKDRTDHMLAVGAQTGLIFLAYRNTDRLRDLISAAAATEPVYDFKCPQGVGQTVWRITDTAPWIGAFAEVPAIYVADGHHRVESAKLARDIRRSENPDHTGAEEYNFVVAGVFPSEDLRIMPYNRVVKDLNGLSEEEFMARLTAEFAVSSCDIKSPDERGTVCLYLNGKWYSLSFDPAGIDRSDPIGSLDVSLLQNRVLSPILNIGDPRTDDRIAFVGGARGTAELERMVDEGDAAVAFSMFATTMDDLFSVADIDEIMPPKSTWFEPKLKDGLLVHLI
ncbi:MAG: DUF1015 domain-containing protein [Pyrinomonadaceae bacterium]